MKYLLAALLLLLGCEYLSPKEKSMRSTVQVVLQFSDLNQCQIGQQCNIRDAGGAKGSGVVLDVNEKTGQSLIVTAGHVAFWPSPPGLVVKRDILIVPWEGGECHAIVLNKPEGIDLVYLVADCVAGVPAELHSGLPRFGDMVYAIGAPDGYHPDHVFALTSGEYLGVDSDATVAVEKDYHGYYVVSAAAAGGNSGGGVWMDGKLLGIVDAYVMKAPALTLAVPVEVIKRSMPLRME